VSIVIPASDAEGTKLNGIIAARAAAIVAAGNNGPLAHAHTIEKAQAQLNLLLYLLSSGKLNASTVLANSTYNT